MRGADFCQYEEAIVGVAEMSLTSASLSVMKIQKTGVFGSPKGDWFDGILQALQRPPAKFL